MQDKAPYNEKGEAHGYWELYWSNGKLQYKGNFINGEQYGSLERYYTNGKIYYKEYYTR